MDVRQPESELGQAELLSRGVELEAREDASNYLCIDGKDIETVYWILLVDGQAFDCAVVQ
jgi:hypothetical protein